jgi:aryl sulfotransferase
MFGTFPQVKHIYQNHHLDSTRWERYIPRDDDIVISTSYKSGTTWTQTIVQGLIFGDGEARYLAEVSPTIDMRLRPLDAVIPKLEAQQHRRFIKSHVPPDGLPYFPQVKYIVVGRDPLDVFMSLWNHYSNYTPEMYRRLNETSGHVGTPFPICPEDIRDFWHGWITQGWFEWESEGYPFWSNLHHTQSWWEYHRLPNVLFIHFNDLLGDLEGEIRRIAEFLDIEISEKSLAIVVNSATFSSMKRNAEKILINGQSMFKGGAQTFFHRGTNGRWRKVLTSDDLELHAAAVARVLTPDCALWLERGRLAE